MTRGYYKNNDNESDIIGNVGGKQTTIVQVKMQCRSSLENKFVTINYFLFKSNIRFKSLSE